MALDVVVMDGVVLLAQKKIPSFGACTEETSQKRLHSPFRTITYHVVMSLGSFQSCSSHMCMDLGIMCNL